MKLLNWKIIQYSLKKGSISSNVAPILGAGALMYVKLNDVKKSNEFATTAQTLSLRIRDDKSNHVQCVMVVSYAMCLLQPFRSLTSPFLQSYKDFKVCASVVAVRLSFSQKFSELTFHILPISLWERSRCR